MRFLLATCILLPVACAAQERPPINTDRPGFSDGSGIVGKGVNQVEAGFITTFVTGDATTAIPDLLFRHGLSDDFELRLSGLSYGFAPMSSQGWLDPSVGFKYRLQRPKGKRGELTFEAQTTVRTSDSDLRANAWNPTLKLLATLPVGDDSIGGNLVWARIGSGDAQFDQRALALSYNHALDAKTGLTLEAYAVDHVSAGEGVGYFASLALTYLSTNDSQWDVRVGTGFNASRDGWLLQGGYSVRF